MITERTKKLIAKFYEDYKEAYENVYGGDIESALAEDISTYYTLEVTILKTKIKYTTTYVSVIGGSSYDESETDDDEARELLKKWRADMRRARRYWETDSDILDKIADGEIEDNNDEE